jgi:hypothetical protein
MAIPATSARAAGVLLLLLSAILLIAPSFSMISGANLYTATGRHLVAGALANLSLSIILVLVTLIPLRRGERWPLGAFMAAFLCYGVPVFLIDATHVDSTRLQSTLAPQAAGLLLILLGMLVFARGAARHGSNHSSK